MNLQDCEQTKLGTMHSAEIYNNEGYIFTQQLKCEYPISEDNGNKRHITTYIYILYTYTQACRKKMEQRPRVQRDITKNMSGRQWKIMKIGAVF